MEHTWWAGNNNQCYEGGLAVGQIGEEKRVVVVPEDEPMRWPVPEREEQEQKEAKPERELVPAGE